MQHPINTQKQLRNAFWRAHPEYQAERRSRKRQNDYRCDIRCAWCDYVDAMRDEIPERLERNATL